MRSAPACCGASDRDLDRIRTFLSGPGPGALFDLPWIPLYVGVCFLFHPLIGLAAAGGAAILAILTISTEIATRSHAKAASAVAAARDSLLEASRRNAEALHAMGMAPYMEARFAAINEEYLQSHGQSADRSSALAAFSRVIRLFLQSVILGLGAYLVINQEASAGVIIASSILTSRALAPVDLVISNWKGFVGAREARRRLDQLLALLPERRLPLPLPSPRSPWLSAPLVRARRGNPAESSRTSPSVSVAATASASSVRAVLGSPL
jgi:ATP-binding cassette subfamily C protein